MAIYKLLLADTTGVHGAKEFPRLLEVKKLGWLSERWCRLCGWLGRRENPSPDDESVKALLDGSFEIAVPVPPHVKDSLVYDLTGVRSTQPVKIVFCFDNRARTGRGDHG